MNKIIEKIFFYRESKEYFWKCYWNAKYARGGGVKLINRLKLHNLNNKYGCGISPMTELEACPEFPHGLYGIFISRYAKIGKNCVIFQQVTIGSNSIKTSASYGAPVIGDDCYIGAGTKIIGGIKIGNHVRIGANCIVCTDVPDNSTVVMGKPRIIPHDYELDNQFYGDISN